MRLRRLDLTRYGKFTDASIDFGERIAGQPDLHILYGPNEAGKSTALAGFMDLLFGMEKQSRYGFLHSYSAMRVGGCLELASGRHELVRVKSPNPTLRNARNEAVAESLLLAELGGIDRAAYRTMFSLDDDTLEAGGKSILASNGELGQLLFSASAGLAELGNRLQALRSDADSFAKTGGRSGELFEGKRQLAELKQQREATDTLASDFTRLRTARDDADAQYQAAEKERKGAEMRLRHIRALLTALPQQESLRRQQAELDKLGDLPDPPPGWAEELPQLEKRQGDLRTEREIAAADAARLARELEAIVVDESALRLTTGLERLEKLRARFVSATLDLPNVGAELTQARAETDALLLRLGRAKEDDPLRLRLTAAETAPLERLIRSSSGIENRVQAANTELAAARQRLHEAQRALGERPQSGNEAGFAHLSSALTVLGQSDHASRLRIAGAAVLEHGAALETCLAGLSPWRASAAELAALVVPDPAAIEAVRIEMERAKANIAQRQEELDRAAALAAATTVELETIATTGVVSDDEANAIRQQRDTAWIQHRLALDATTADAFEAAMRRDDGVTGARAAHQRELAELTEKKRMLARQQSDVRQSEGALRKAVSQQETALAGFAALLAAIDTALTEIPDPSSLRAWTERREKALQLWQELEKAKAEITTAETEANNLRDRMRLALGQAGITSDPEATLDFLETLAELAIEQEKETGTLREAVANRQEEIERRDQALQEALREERRWRKEWQEACSGCWLGETGALPPVETVAELLKGLSQLEPLLQKQQSLALRVQGMEADQTEFAAEVMRLSRELALDAGDDPEHAARMILEKVTQAGRFADTRRELQTRFREAEEKRQRAEDAQQILNRRISEMTQYMGAESLIELAERLKDAARKKELERAVSEASSIIVTALQVETLDAAEAMLAPHSAPELEAEGNRLQSELETLTERWKGLFSAAGKAADALAAVGGDDAVAKLEEQRRTLLLTIEDRASRYLRLWAGIQAAERALRVYRDQHRSAMLRHASDAFGAITRGAYRGLTTQPDKDGDVLVAITAQGSSKLAPDLSKGTRFQLYLALRAAGYQEFAGIRAPVPFIADDIMETFDDLRAEETLRLFSEMARSGQVIYLTHHAHLCRMAEAIPGAHIRQLA